ncbi:hypothetical protein ASG87_04930 [Frateuria sp. Soil773]|nr:hypothetical protein ASG87_04930 [Frateuria sp. Soil773]
MTQWLAEIKSSTRPKTFKIKATAVEGFARHYGEKSSLKDAGRIDVGNWVQALRAGGLQTPTIVNKCSYLRGFFDWAKARGYYPPFAKDENPASGQVVYGTREKRKRRALGFKPFTNEQIQALYAPKTMEKGLSEAARWGAWVCKLYGRTLEQLAVDLDRRLLDEKIEPALRIKRKDRVRL